ncbi:hypothetical protein COW36_14615 [bacterium (Candidatus Blackallbacteria) CG17_big_fil_post_rev_8_21_14_2_50_48_46]|uniref:Thiol-disulfide oxidoreductase n=1 Tax=bacterium (Candidatus Blackallbacteria) CG17_big_fil_post_rev_8_21_14_2_50_48_46 TaxID=2014261 RepID=A0A2M7G2B7_9BACT|nr:MAG: hypothetical protein COW64_11935 [bacterium (Candidatus Blackallbacteria) CG18_big_fil_WC_8_21_14_2_50_49_26]PIW15947.1 MAG: hypothetical protein COW36_14615 [bacterium (Candidatus Blackallbacteria) CG17_big_fil_post_rev_8_21_14_2_50_48_46]PIW50359.1 MAG: hypothetical protein COW20_02330 [bacterium (Candidatus Blackallbacteria) CG13_big_fil_rev_8_21_14_2_50_49_14]
MTETTFTVLFDGVCNLCNASVQFIIDRDPKAKFHFASLQSEVGQELLKAHKLPTEGFSSLVLLENDLVYIRSTGALRIARQLQYLRWMGLFLVIPAFIRDSVYDFIARNRYRWFGKQESCRIPTPELKSRFLS